MWKLIKILIAFRDLVIDFGNKIWNPEIPKTLKLSKYPYNKKLGLGTQKNPKNHIVSIESA